MHVISSATISRPRLAVSQLIENGLHTVLRHAAEVGSLARRGLPPSGRRPRRGARPGDRHSGPRRRRGSVIRGGQLVERASGSRSTPVMTTDAPAGENPNEVAIRDLITSPGHVSRVPGHEPWWELLLRLTRHRWPRRRGYSPFPRL